MTKGRKLGQNEISLEEITKIIELTKAGKSRGQISEELGWCKKTVYNWQKKLLWYVYFMS